MGAETVKILEQGHPHKQQILSLESGFNLSLLKDFHFPPTDIRERIGSLPKITHTATNFKEKGVKVILEEANGDPIVVDISKASQQEINSLSQLADTNKNILLVNDKKNVDPILRDVCEQIISYKQKGKNPVGAIAFQIFIEELFIKHKADVLLEWNTYIVEHETAGKAKSAEDTHHYSNVGLKTKSEGNDLLREEVIAFVREIMNCKTVNDDAKKIFSNSFRKKHDHIIKFEDFLLAIGMAEFSNFVRGGILTRGRKGDEKFFVKNEYMPRRLAAEVIDEVTEVLKEKNNNL
jgi:hypothetical protein